MIQRDEKTVFLLQRHFVGAIDDEDATEILVHFRILVRPKAASLVVVARERKGGVGKNGNTARPVSLVFNLQRPRFQTFGARHENALGRAQAGAA